MAKVRVKGLTGVFNSIDAIFENATEKASFLNMLKDFVILRVQAETRKGKDLVDNGSPQLPLSDDYIKWRKTLKARANALDRLAGGSEKVRDLKLAAKITERTPTPDPEYFRPAFSNLTLTGQMLRSLTGKIWPMLRRIEVNVSGTRDDGETNASVAKDLAKRGRTFLGLDLKGKKMLRKFVLDELRKQIRLRK